MEPKKRDLVGDLQREQLHSAARDGDLAEIERLLANKYPVNRFDFIGKTPIHYAVAQGNFTIIDRLLRAGANVNANDESQIGNTPLSDVASICSFEIAKRLIDAGADPTIKGWMQLSAIDRADRRKDNDAKKIQRLFRDAEKRKRGK